MERLMLVAPLAALLALEVYHCARRNSWRFSALFFGAAVVFGIIRGNIIGFITWYHGDTMPYAVRGAAVKLGFTSLIEPFGWAFALYGSWFLAEGILKKVTRQPANIFATAFLAAIFTGGFSWAVESAATPMNWWHWRIANVADPFVYAIPMVGIMDWASVAVDFLMPFFIIECTPWGKSRWSLFLGLIFAAHMLTHTFRIDIPDMLASFDMWHWLTVWALAAAALIFPVSFGSPRGGTKTVSLWGDKPELLDILPFISIAGMLAIVTYAAVVVSGDLRLLYSVLPLAAGMLLAAPRVPVIPVVIALGLASLARAGAFPAFLPGALALLYAPLAPPRRSKALVAVAVTAALVGLAAYYPWSYYRTVRLQKLQNELQTMIAMWTRRDYSGAIEHARAAQPLICKFAGGQEITLSLLRAAWLSRDKEAWDAAAAELATFGPQYKAVQGLWDVGTEREMSERLEKMTES